MSVVHVSSLPFQMHGPIMLYLRLLPILSTALYLCKVQDQLPHAWPGVGCVQFWEEKVVWTLSGTSGPSVILIFISHHACCINYIALGEIKKWLNPAHSNHNRGYFFSLALSFYHCYLACPLTLISFIWWVLVSKPFSFSSFFPTCIAAVIVVRANNCYAWQSHLAATLLTNGLGTANTANWKQISTQGCGIAGGPGSSLTDSQVFNLLLAFGMYWRNLLKWLVSASFLYSMGTTELLYIFSPIHMRAFGKFLDCGIQI